MGWILRIVLLFIVVRMVWRLIGGVIDGIAGKPAPSRGRPEQAVALVKDPVCGTYVVKAKALAASVDGQTTWFCSERCRDTWRAAHAGSRIA